MVDTSPHAEVNGTALSVEISAGQINPTDRNSLPGYADQPIKAKTLRTNLDREAVAGGEANYLLPYVRSLPHYVDDLTQSFGDNLYDRMLTDPAVSAATETLKTSVLSSGVEIIPAVQKGKEGYERAQKFADFIKYALDELGEPIEQTIDELLYAIAYGNKSGEAIYKIGKYGSVSGKLVPDRIKVKPREVLAFVVDAYMNHIGFLALRPGSYSPLLVDSALIDPAPDNLLPREKFTTLTYLRQDSDPRGRSALRSAYVPWWFKTQVWPEMMAHMARFAGGWLQAETPGDSAEKVEALDPITGDALLSAGGDPSMIPIARQILTALLQMRSGSAGVFPKDSKVTATFPPSSSMNPYEVGIQVCNDEITKAILYQTLATGEGKHQARAASETHQDILGLLVGKGKRAVCQMLYRDIFQNLIRWNYGERYLALTPKASLAESEQQDFATNATAVAALFSCKYLAPSQLPETDQMLSLPVRSKEEVEAYAQSLVQQANPTDPNNPNPGGDPNKGKEPGKDGKPDATGTGDQSTTTDPASDEIKAAFAQEKGHWISTKGGGHIFIPDTEGAAPTKGDIAKAVTDHYGEGEHTGAITAKLSEAQDKGELKSHKDLHHSLLIASAAHESAKEKGTATGDHPTAATVQAALSSGGVAGLKANAESHADAGVKAQASALHAKVAGQISDTKPKKAKPEKQPLTTEQRSELAKSNARIATKEIQRYSEERNEPQLAALVGGTHIPGNNPPDVEMRDASGNLLHGLELKTLTANKKGAITMHGDARRRKLQWSQENGVDFHTIVFDDQKIFNANGEGQHGPDSDRQIYYRRGVGNFSISAMEPVRDGEHLKELIGMAHDDLPAKAKPLKTYQSPKAKTKAGEEAG